MMHARLVEPLYIKTFISVELIQPEEILFCQVEENHSSIKLTNNRSVFTNYTLKELDEILRAYATFYRCHAKYILNLRQIKSYYHKSGEVHTLEGHVIKVAKDRKPDFYRSFKTYASV